MKRGKKGKLFWNFTKDFYNPPSLIQRNSERIAQPQKHTVYKLFTTSAPTISAVSQNDWADKITNILSLSMGLRTDNWADKIFFSPAYIKVTPRVFGWGALQKFPHLIATRMAFWGGTFSKIQSMFTNALYFYKRRFLKKSPWSNSNIQSIFTFIPLI